MAVVFAVSISSVAKTSRRLDAINQALTEEEAKRLCDCDTEEVIPREDQDREEQKRPVVLEDFSQ